MHSLNTAHATLRSIHDVLNVHSLQHNTRSTQLCACLLKCQMVHKSVLPFARLAVVQIEIDNGAVEAVWTLGTQPQDVMRRPAHEMASKSVINMSTSNCVQ